ncbi:MAG: type II secretion system minor pseudopilin GspK [Gammaproteobacteria bacterium]|nr:type II secretion system minor pseudopilin GspK [Gammaproteobacteria bacterium]MDH5303075.1 type II secretion system minor pseudopilin GspK [Gammaproteobacteria bacterium]MDH5322887.1 type II secretion system minor pseudopilin GspK [Gammaproteobacteria bacterium]
MRPAYNKGVALLTALLITALLATLAITLKWNNALDIRRTVVMLNRDQAIQVALGAESWIQNILRDDYEDDPDHDHLGEIWASELPPLPIDGGEIFGVIEDLQGRFNVNNLIDANGDIDQEAQKQFQNLLNALQLDPRFAGITADWIDADDQASFPDGAEDAIYTGFTPPYRAANQFLSNASELGAIEGMDKESFDILSPHIVALPRHTGINVNTATGPVLQSLSETMSVGDVESLFAAREGTGFTSLDIFDSYVEGALQEQLEESTSYFQLKLIVRIDTVRITYYSILERGPQGDVTPILRSLGTT